MERLKQYTQSGQVQLAKLDNNNNPVPVPYSQIADQVGRQQKNAGLYKMISQLTWQQKYEWVNFKRLKAKEKYQSSQFEEAIQIYIQSLIGIDLNDTTQNRLQQMKFDLKYPILLNISTCLYMKKQYQKAINLCDKVLEQNKQHLPAIFKKAYLLLKKGNYMQSKQLLNSGLRIAKQTNNQKFIKDFIMLNGDLMKLSKQNKNLYARMFNQDKQNGAILSTQQSENSNEQSQLLEKKKQQEEQILYYDESICKKIFECLTGCLYSILPCLKPLKRKKKQKIQASKSV